MYLLFNCPQQRLQAHSSITIFSENEFTWSKVIKYFLDTLLKLFNCCVERVLSIFWCSLKKNMCWSIPDCKKHWKPNAILVVLLNMLKNHVFSFVFWAQIAKNNIKLCFLQNVAGNDEKYVFSFVFWAHVANNLINPLFLNLMLFSKSF